MKVGMDGERSERGRQRADWGRFPARGRFEPGPAPGHCPNARFWIAAGHPVHGLVLLHGDGRVSMSPEAVMVGSERMFFPGEIGQRGPLLAPQHVVHSADLGHPL